MSPRARVKVPLATPACRDCKKMTPKKMRTEAVISPDDGLFF